MQSKLLNVILGSVVILFALFILYSVSGFNNNDSEDISIEITSNTNEIIKYNPDDTYTPENWSGLPLSRGNTLYVDPINGGSNYQAAYKSLVKKILLMTADDYLHDDQLWEDIATTYETLIGWNGIFDAIDYCMKVQKYDRSPRLHKIGELLQEHTDNDHPRYAVEISSRNILHKAPMHGSVWALVANIDDLTSDELFSLVYNDLCYFKNYEDMANLWISCVHGIGHGLAGANGMNGIKKSLDVCASQSDCQFQYGCATGIFMDLESEIQPNTFFPCDQYQFPGSCYRFKARLFNMVLGKENDPCRTQSDEYHRIGCIWGWAYVQSDSPLDYYKVCEFHLPENNDNVMQYRHAACIDGFLSARPLYSQKNNKQVCEDLKEYPLSYKACLKRKNVDFQKFTFKEQDDYFYNCPILEKYNQGITQVDSAEWLTEWNRM